MGYRRALLVRWSRRDRLAVLVVAVTVAFLTGATVLLFAVGAQTAGVAAEFDSPGSVEYVDGVPEAGAGEVVLPVAVVESNRSTGSRTVVGVPEGATIQNQSLRTTNATTLGTASAPRTERLTGSDGAVVGPIQPRGKRGVLPPDWYVSDPATVRELGASGAYRIDGDAEIERPSGTPLLGALAFFLLGTREAVGTLGATAGGAALLVAVTVYSVSRMSVRDRLDTIQVVRATGGTPRDVLGVFTLRAGLVTGAGILLGYAIGVITASGAVNVAVAVGLPTALPVGVTSEVVRVLVPLYGGTLAVGLLAGAIAAYPAATCPPGAVTRLAEARRIRRLPDALRLRVLEWRTLVPTTATLTTFVVFVVLVAGLAGAAGPVFASDDVTVTEPGSNHPISSKVPAAYAEALQSRDIDASAEILLFEVVDGQPFPARGAEFGAFANVSEARLVAGRPHEHTDEAVVGEGLARTLGVEVGDSLTLGGSTRPGFTRVEVVGVFAAEGSTDDQLVVSLATARHLAGIRDGVVQFVRAERLPATNGDSNSGVDDVTDEPTGSGVDIVDVSPTGPVVADETFQARATVRNFELAGETVDVTLQYRGQTVERSVTIPATATRRVTATFEAGDAGTAELRAGNATTSVTVRSPDAISLEGVPTELPADSEPLVRVLDTRGGGVGGATLTVANESRRTRGNGWVRLPPLKAGTYTVAVRAGNRTTNTSVRVSKDARIQPSLSTSVLPGTPSLLDQPTARVRLSNPWNRTLVREVRVIGPGATAEQTVRLAPGQSTSVDTRLERRSPGSYTVEVSLNGSQVTTAEYQVTGDDRVVAALASSGRSGSSGVGQAAESAFGNLQVVFGALLGLAGLMTVGGTTAAFAGAVHARHRTLGIHRSTGATPQQVFGLVLRDAALVGGLAAVLAVLLAHAGLFVLGELGYLTAFGVRLGASLAPVSLLATVLGGVGLTVVAAGLATVAVVRSPPADLLAPVRAVARGETDG